MNWISLNVAARILGTPREHAAQLAHLAGIRILAVAGRRFQYCLEDVEALAAEREDDLNPIPRAARVVLAATTATA